MLSRLQTAHIMRPITYLAIAFGAAVVTSCQQDVTPPSRLNPGDLRPRSTIKPGDEYTRGIYYYPGWTYISSANGYAGEEWPGGPDAADGNEWTLISTTHDNYTPDRSPQSGFVDEDQQAIADQQINYMAGSGFTYVAYQMGWSHNKWRANHADPARVYMDYALRNHMSSSVGAGLKFAITWQDVQAQDSNYWNHPLTTQLGLPKSISMICRLYFIPGLTGT